MRLSYPSVPAALGLLLSACQPDQQETPPRLKPLLETLSPRYRSLDSQDTLDSYWAPDSVLLDSLFSFTAAHRSQVLVQVRFVPASTAVVAGLDTMRFRRTEFRFEDYNRPGYYWSFFSGRSTDPDLTEVDDVPVRLAMSYSWRYILQEQRRWPDEDPTDTRTYERNAYLMDYPFQVEAEARINDSVFYVRVVPMRPSLPQPDTLYPYFAYGPPIHQRYKRIPFVADQLDTTRLALLRLSFRVLNHSAD